MAFPFLRGRCFASLPQTPGESKSPESALSDQDRQGLAQNQGEMVMEAGEARSGDVGSFCGQAKMDIFFGEA
jgi:hypothetical protein